MSQSHPQRKVYSQSDAPTRDQQAYQALERLLREVREGKLTGRGAVELEFHQGGITDIQISRKEKV